MTWLRHQSFLVYLQLHILLRFKRSNVCYAWYTPQKFTNSQRGARLHALRRPIRPASTEKKIAERKVFVETRHKEALQDPTLLSTLNFADNKELHPHTKCALIDSMGLQTMTDVQAQTFPISLAGHDILARARTGTGKTLAFLIPTVERIVRNPTFLPGSGIGCLIIAPTRELAIQICGEAEKLLFYHSNLSVQVMYGGTKMARDGNLFNKRLPCILVSTPGRLLEHLQETKIHGRKFSDVIGCTEILILDEFDKLLEMGFRRDIDTIVTYLPRKEKRQTLLFSATTPTSVTRVIKEMIRSDYMEVDCTKNEKGSLATNLRVTQSYVILPDIDNFILSIHTILTQATRVKPFKIMVFFPTARLVTFFARFLGKGLDHPVMELHSKKSQSSRNTASENFKHAKSAILFTTDLSARGIDYPDVTQVIQIGIPESREQYIHRLGRTARAGRDGNGLLILLPFESHFLTEMKGIDVPLNKSLSILLEKQSQNELPEWMVQNFDRVRSKGNTLSACAHLAYSSFLGYYLAQMNRIHMRSKEEVVRVSNDFSRGTGLGQVPSLSRKILNKLGLLGVSGIIVNDIENRH